MPAEQQLTVPSPFQQYTDPQPIPVRPVDGDVRLLRCERCGALIAEQGPVGGWPTHVDWHRRFVHTLDEQRQRIDALERFLAHVMPGEYAAHRG